MINSWQEDNQEYVVLGANEETVSRKECQMLLAMMNKVKTVCSSGLATWKLLDTFQEQFWWSCGQVLIGMGK